jgi:hypothetical protein
MQPNNPYQAPQHGPTGMAQHGASEMQYDPAEVEQRLKKLNTQSFVFGVPGLILQAVGYNVVGGLAGLAVGLLGTGLLIFGLSFYARSRGQHPAFAALGFLSCLGLLILALLPKKCIVCGGGSKKGRCLQCGAPVAK